VQDNVLEKNLSPNLRVYAIWFPMIATDARSRWNWFAGVIDDPRVVHLWDENKVIGKWLAEQPDLKGFDGGVVWDTYLLYGPQARWDLTPSPLISWGYTINNTRGELLKNISPLLEEKKN
jgi:hypothetical protein